MVWVPLVNIVYGKKISLRVYSMQLSSNSFYVMLVHPSVRPYRLFIFGNIDMLISTAWPELALVGLSVVPFDFSQPMFEFARTRFFCKILVYKIPSLDFLQILRTN